MRSDWNFEEHPHCATAWEYAEKVISGEIIACRYVRLACKRHLNDFKKSKKTEYPYFFSPEAAERICRFIEKLPHIKGVWATRGELITLADWQCFILVVAFGWLSKETGFRRFTELYLEVPRKNGKTLLAAAIGLYMLVADGEAGAEIFAGASSEKQADKVFSPATAMVNKLPDMKEAFGLEVLANRIIQPSKNAFFYKLIGKPGDGDSPSCALLDEYHEHTSDVQYDAMATGVGSRAQPMVVVITTAGKNISSPCYRLRGAITKVLEGVSKEDSVFGIIYTLDKEDDWREFKNWKKANPNLGISLFEKTLRTQLNKALSRTDKQNILRCKHLNQWVNAGVAWIDMDKWANCEDPTLKIEDYYGCECWIGIDLASKIDIAVMLITFKINELYICFGKYYLPRARLEEEGSEHYQAWEKDGLLTITDGERIDYGYIENDVLEIMKMFDLLGIVFDPHEAGYMMTRIQEKTQLDEELFVEVPQNPTRISEPMKELEAIYRAGNLRFYDPILTWMASNVIKKTTYKKAYFPSKENPDNKIDGIVALIMIISRFMTKKDTKSGYEDGGVVAA